MSMKDLNDAECKDEYMSLCHALRNGIMVTRKLLRENFNIMQKADHRLQGIEQELFAIMDLRRLKKTNR